jgi:hypothetical protein
MTYAFAYSENKANSTVLVLKCCYHSTMQLNGVFHDGEAETCASEFAAPALVDTVEPLEDTRQMLLRYSNAIVGEGELPMGVGVGMCKGYRGAVARVGYGVVGEVAEDAMDERRVGASHKRGGQLVVEMHPMFFQLQCRSVENLLHYL